MSFCHQEQARGQIARELAREVATKATANDLPEGWIYETKDKYGDPQTPCFVRSDGAVVRETRDQYWAQPWLDGHRPWVAFRSDGRGLCYHKRRKGGTSPFGSTRRWKTALAAMKALDREFPKA